MMLRPYQREAVDAVVNQFRGDATSTLLVLPTGTGKTIVFAHLIGMAQRGRVMVVAHREELIDQAARKVEAVTGHTPSIEMAERKADESMFRQSKVVVASVQTLIAGFEGKGRMSRFKPEQFSLIIFDEAHHIESKSWQQVVEYFKDNTKCKILGVTATPKRHDKLALGNTFDTVAYTYPLTSAINDGWLVPIEQQTVEVTSLDYSTCRTTAGDLNGRDLASVMEEETNLHGVTGPTLEITGDRRTLVFAASVKAAERMCEIFNREKPRSARWICGKTPKQERRQIVEEYAAGEFQYLVNVGCLTEGFDDPGVEVIALAKPTKSTSLWTQMIGRGTRPLPGTVDGPQCETKEDRESAIKSSAKPRLLVLCFAGNAGRHQLIEAFDLLGGRYPQGVRERASRIAKTADHPVDIDETLALAEEELKEEADKKRRLAEAKRSKLRAKVKYQKHKVNPFNLLGIRRAPDGQRTDGDFGPSEKMSAMLVRNGIDPTGLSHSEARTICGKIVQRFREGKCTMKQANLLSRFGCDTDVSKAEASRIIDDIANGGWTHGVA